LLMEDFGFLEEMKKMKIKEEEGVSVRVSPRQGKFLNL
ncbi:hypothetical protein A2U01_0074100, partial [Trifolium medium]|nr:hypothetical protein [Trifolium medium]